MGDAGAAVEVVDLRRTFSAKKRPEVTALDGVSLTVQAGEVHGLLGPNGAGKTTLVKVLSTVLLPTSGTARILGHDVVRQTAAVRPLIGIVLGDDRGLYGRLTARQNLHYWAALYRMPPDKGRARAGELLVASPTSPVLVLMGRSVFFILNGLVLSLGALVIVGPMFDVALAWSRVPALVAPLVLVTASVYMAALFVGGIVLRFTGARRTAANIARLAMMAFCGVSVPRSLFPVPVQRLADLLPLTHGLDAIRELFGAADAGTMLGYAGLEALVAAGWTMLALATFRRMADAGRRDGSIVFSTA